MNCERVKDLLAAYLDRELTEAETCEVHGHLAGCAACRRLLEEMRAVDVLLTACPTMRASATFERKFRHRVQRHRHFVVFWRPLLRGAVAAAAVLSLAAAVWLMAAVPEKAESPLALPDLDLLTDPSFLGTERYGYERVFPGAAVVEVPIFTPVVERGGV